MINIYSIIVTTEKIPFPSAGGGAGAGGGALNC